MSSNKRPDFKDISLDEIFKNLVKDCIPTTKETFFRIVWNFYSSTFVEEKLKFEIWPGHNEGKPLVYYHVCILPDKGDVSLIGYMCIDKQYNYSYFADNELIQMHNSKLN